MGLLAIIHVIKQVFAGPYWSSYLQFKQSLILKRKGNYCWSTPSNSTLSKASWQSLQLNHSFLNLPKDVPCIPEKSDSRRAFTVTFFKNLTQVLERKKISFFFHVSLYIMIKDFFMVKTWIFYFVSDFLFTETVPETKNTFNVPIFRYKSLWFRGSVKIFIKYLFRTIAHTISFRIRLI